MTLLKKLSVDLLIVLMILTSPAVIMASEDVIQTAKPGDINSDRKLDVQDLLALLKRLINPALQSNSDVNRDGKTDIFDLLALLRLYSSVTAPPPSDDDLSAIVKMSRSKLHSGSLGMSVYGKIVNDSTRAFKVNFSIYANKEISSIRLDFNGNLFSEISDSVTIIIPESHYEANEHIYRSDSIAWRLSVVAKDGGRFTQEGKTSFRFPGPNVVLDRLYPFCGDEIEFPLVLKGPWQRFASFQWDNLGDHAVEIDLNPTGSDSVLFADIDTLAASIMWEIIKNDTSGSYKYGNFVHVTAAQRRDGSGKTNRLIFDAHWMGGYPRLRSLDGNRLLLHKLGLKEWLLSIEAPFLDTEFQTQDTYQLWRDKFGK